MKSHLFMNFSIDKENNQINVKREFAASLTHVWAAWTEKELLDQWWAPKPWKTRTKSMDFREGGLWLYAMVGPNNEEHWCRADYKEIITLKSFHGLDAFCNEEGEINTNFPRTDWKVGFGEFSGSTFVTIQLTYDTLTDLEKIIEMGFKEGFTMGLGNLDELLKG
jgi:uncharacterized protein YndB with AHSA1/START domain